MAMIRVRVRVRAMIMMALALAAIITRAGAVTGQGHRLRSTGHCKAGYAAVNESQCEDIADAVGYSWWRAAELSSEPPGCWVGNNGNVNYNRLGVDGGAQDCSVNSDWRCICACVSGRYSNSTTPADGECTACDSGKRFSTSVLLAVDYCTATRSLTQSHPPTYLLTYLLAYSLARLHVPFYLLPSSFSFPSFSLPLCFFMNFTSTFLILIPHPHSLSVFISSLL